MAQVSARSHELPGARSLLQPQVLQQEAGDGRPQDVRELSPTKGSAGARQTSRSEEMGHDGFKKKNDGGDPGVQVALDG